MKTLYRTIRPMYSHFITLLTLHNPPPTALSEVEESKRNYNYNIVKSPPAGLIAW